MFLTVMAIAVTIKMAIAMEITIAIARIMETAVIMREAMEAIVAPKSVRRRKLRLRLIIIKRHMGANHFT